MLAGEVESVEPLGARSRTGGTLFRLSQPFVRGKAVGWLPRSTLVCCRKNHSSVAGGPDLGLHSWNSYEAAWRQRREGGTCGTQSCKWQGIYTPRPRRRHPPEITTSTAGMFPESGFQAHIESLARGEQWQIAGYEGNVAATRLRSSSTLF